jgi:hypothetical protein
LSKLTQLAARRAQREARRAFSRTPIGEFVDFAQRVKSGRYSRRQHQRILSRVRQLGSSRLAREVERFGGPHKYAAKKLTEAGLDYIWQSLGPLGGLLKFIWGQSKKSESLDVQLDAAKNLLEQFGYQVIPPQTQVPKDRDFAAVAESVAEEGILRPPRQPEPAVQPRRPGRPGQPGPARQPPPGGLGGEAIDVRGEVLPPPLPGQRRTVAERLIRSPQSSNVYAYGYDQQTATMYVQFLAPTMNTGSVKKSRRGPGFAKGRLGSTISGKSNVGGPMYAYFNVPPRVFDAMDRASSKGGAVWDFLRVRGSVWQHQFSYRLVTSSIGVGPNVDYVPRKAHKGGFARRRIIESGRELRSLLPSIGLNRGTPNRGAPNRGRPGG